MNAPTNEEIEIKYVPVSIHVQASLGEVTAAEIDAANEAMDRILDDIDARISLSIGCMPPSPSRMTKRRIAKLPKAEREVLLAAFAAGW